MSCDPLRPIVFSLDDAPGYRADFVLATLLEGGSANSQAPPISSSVAPHVPTGSTGETTDMSIKTADDFSRTEAAASSSAFCPPPSSSVRVSRGRRGAASGSSNGRNLAGDSGERRRGDFRPPGGGFVPEPPPDATDFVEGMDLDGFTGPPLEGASLKRPHNHNHRDLPSGSHSLLAADASVAMTTKLAGDKRGQSSRGRTGEFVHPRGHDPMDALFEVDPDMLMEDTEECSYGFSRVGGDRGTVNGSRESGEGAGGVPGVGPGFVSGSQRSNEAEPAAAAAERTLPDDEFFADDLLYKG